MTKVLLRDDLASCELLFTASSGQKLLTWHGNLSPHMAWQSVARLMSSRERVKIISS